VIKLLQEQKNIQQSKTLIEWVVDTYGKDPFLILVACLLSLRARDSQVQKIFPGIVSYIRTPQLAIQTPVLQLETLLYSLGFYKAKSKTVRSVSRELIDFFDSQVPCTLEELVSIKGIGRKTANIVLQYAFGVPTVAVDVHAHRVSNRIGMVCSTTVEQTEVALMSCVDKKWWHVVNRCLVLWGQQICLPRSPHCSLCALKKYCCYYSTVQKHPKK
jgi:endonuclease-3